MYSNKNEIFSLDERYYGTNTLNEIETKDLNELIDEKKSFALFIYQPLCDTSSKFESILKKFQETTPISFYKIKFTSIKNTNLEKYIKFCFLFPKGNDIIKRSCFMLWMEERICIHLPAGFVSVRRTRMESCHSQAL